MDLNIPALAWWLLKATGIAIGTFVVIDLFLMLLFAPINIYKTDFFGENKIEIATKSDVKRIEAEGEKL